MNANIEFEELKREFFCRLLERNPDWSTTIGAHDPYDYLLPRGDTAKIMEDLELFNEYENRKKRLINYNELTYNNKVDWDILEMAVEMFEFTFFEQRQHELNPDALGHIFGIVFLMITNDYAPFEKRVTAITSRIEKLPRYLNEFRTRFEKTNPVKLWVEMAIVSAEQIPNFLSFLEKVAEQKVTETTYSNLEKSITELKIVLQEHFVWLSSLQNKSTESFALGAEKVEKLIRLRRLGMSSDEILQLGYKYLSNLKAERKKVAEEIGPGKNIDGALKSIETKSPRTFEEAMDFTRKAMEEAKQYIINNNLATVYKEDKLVVEETPAFMAQLLPFAALNMPSRFDRPMIGQYIITRPKNIDNLKKHLNFWSICNTAVHEAFPGHFLQGLASNRNSVFHLLAFGTETTEGWAHYCEQMMLEKGFLRGAKARFVQLNDAIWRALRIIIDVKLSRGEISYEQAVGLLVTEASLTPEAANAEIKRYTLTPGYPLSYLLGKHLILQQREIVKKKMAERFTDKFFHDTIASNGFLPMYMIKKIFESKFDAFE